MSDIDTSFANGVQGETRKGFRGCIDLVGNIIVLMFSLGAIYAFYLRFAS